MHALYPEGWWAGDSIRAGTMGNRKCREAMYEAVVRLGLFSSLRTLGAGKAAGYSTGTLGSAQVW